MLVEVKSYTEDQLAAVSRHQRPARLMIAFNGHLTLKCKYAKQAHFTCWIDTVKTARFLVMLVMFTVIPGNARADDSQIYLEEIKPLLKARCYACHGRSSKNPIFAWTRHSRLSKPGYSRTAGC